MSTMSVTRAVISSLCVFGLAALVGFPAFAQQLSPEQLRILQDMPAQQRAEIMRALGIDTNGTGMTSAPEFPQLVMPAPEDEQSASQADEPYRLTPGDSVIVTLQRREQSELPASAFEVQEEAFRRNGRLAEIEGSFSYEISSQGKIEFPGVAAVPVAGLTEDQAARRLEAEPALAHFLASVLYLPLQPLGPEGLQLFGQDLFQGAPVTFAPATDVPVPPDYVLGPGDTLIVQLFGKQNDEYSLAISRDGSVSFPGLGPIVLAGLTFQEARELIGQRVAEKMIGVNASVTMGPLRSVTVFILGDVNQPGSFTVSGLSTITNALFVSGGISPIGSLRDIQLKRAGQVVGRLDLYDLLLRGNTSGDLRLMPNDVIFVPPRGPVVSVAGEVQRPAIYELRGERDLADVIQLAGGFSPAAFPPLVRVERVDKTDGRVIEVLNLSDAKDRAFPASNGDVIEVGSILDRLNSHVTLEGQVLRPGHYQWREGMRISDLLPSLGMLDEDADRRYVLVQRRRELSGPLEVFSVDLERALAAVGSAEDPLLQNRDIVTVFDLGAGRLQVLDPVVDTLRLQAEFGQPSREVAVGGMVRAPGTYPLEDGMRVSDLIRAGGSLSDSAFAPSAEIARYEVVDGQRRETEVLTLDIAAILAGDLSQDMALQPFDFLNIQRISGWREQASVELRGEVSFPGTYPIRPGETLAELLERAGGLTPEAFAYGSVFLREELLQREQAEIDRLTARLERDLQALSLQAARSGALAAQAGARTDFSMVMGESILQELRSAEAVGRLAIDLPAIVAGSAQADIRLKDGDRLFVPQFTEEVTVIGEVQYPTSHVYRQELQREDYVSASGGMTRNADERRTYVVRANGSVVAGQSDYKWFRQGGGGEIQPGDTIVVPMDVDRVPALALWQSASTILFNLAIAVTAISAL